MHKNPSNERPLKVIIADDHPVYRRGVISLFRQVALIETIVQAGNGREVLDLLEKDRYDVVLMDIRMPVMDGIAATKEIRKRFPDTYVIAVSSYDDQSYILDMILAGASGYLVKSAGKEDFLEAIRKVTNDQTYFSDEINQRLRELHSRRPDGLTESEMDHPLIREIVFLLCNEFTNAEIADILNRSVRTIENYRTKIVNSGSGATLIGVLRQAMDRGILEDPKLLLKFEKELTKKKKK